MKWVNICSKYSTVDFYYLGRTLKRQASSGQMSNLDEKETQHGVQQVGFGILSELTIFSSKLGQS